MALLFPFLVQSQEWKLAENVPLRLLSKNNALPNACILTFTQMVRTENAQDEHKYPWWQVFLGVLHQYPAKERKDILSVDTIDRSYDPERGILRTTKLYISKREVPAWVQKIAKIPYYEYSREEVKIDIINKTMETKLVLLNWKSFIKDYTLTRYYVQSASNPGWIARQTRFHCDAAMKKIGWMVEKVVYNSHQHGIPTSRISLATSINSLLERFPCLANNKCFS